MKTIGMTGKMSPLFSEFSKCFAASAINYYVICFHAIKFSSQVIGKEKHRDRNSCKRKGKKVRESDPSSQESSSSSCVFLFRSLSFSFFSATSLKRQCEVQRKNTCMKGMFILAMNSLVSADTRCQWEEEDGMSLMMAARDAYFGADFIVTR